MTGLIAGGGLTWILRLVSSVLLGQEALGFGDVTLMAMIGSFVGWQPILATLAIIVASLFFYWFYGRIRTNR